MNFATLLIAVGSISIVVGYFRLVFINHSSPHNVSLTRWMFTGGLPEFVIGLFKGTANLITLQLEPNSRAALLVYTGIMLIVLGLSFV